MTLSCQSRAIKFIEDNYDSFSREGLRYAIEKLDKTERLRLLYLKKNQEAVDDNSEIEYSSSEEDHQSEEPSKQSKIKVHNN